MVSNKDRLYVALYARGVTEGELYHWALLVGPKDETQGAQGKRYHVKNRIDPETGRPKWVYEELDVPMHSTGMLLVRVLIAKIEKSTRLGEVLSRVPIIQDDVNWNCKNWVKDALHALDGDGKTLGTARTEWAYVEEKAYWYVDFKKSQQRYDATADWDLMKVPTYDVLASKEIVE